VVGRPPSHDGPMLRSGCSYPNLETATCIPETQEEKNKGGTEKRGGGAERGGEKVKEVRQREKGGESK
jgi:hypothetical protein